MYGAPLSPQRNFMAELFPPLESPPVEKNYNQRLDDFAEASFNNGVMFAGLSWFECCGLWGGINGKPPLTHLGLREWHLGNVAVHNLDKTDASSPFNGGEVDVNLYRVQVGAVLLKDLRGTESVIPPFRRIAHGPVELMSVPGELVHIFNSVKLDERDCNQARYEVLDRAMDWVSNL